MPTIKKGPESSHVPDRSRELEKSVRVVFCTSDELASLIDEMQGDQAQRFERPDAGGAFELFYADDLGSSHDQTSRYIVLFEGAMVVGIGKLRKSPSDQNTYEFSVSVDPRFQGKGYGTRISEEAGAMAKSEGWTLSVLFTDQGRERLKHKGNELARHYGVEVVEDEMEKRHGS